MKKLLFLLSMICFAAASEAQIYTPMKGTQITYLKVDSGFAIPVRDTVLGRNVNRPGLFVCRPQDSLLYYYNGVSWDLLQGGGGDYSNKVDSVTVTGDYLFYWINGVSYGYLLPTAGWGFNGNPGCDGCFLGTTGPHPLRFIQYDTVRAVIDTLGLFGIGTSHPDAILDVASTSSGALLPRMTNSDMLAIAVPITGMLVYNTTSDSLYFYSSDSVWQPVGTGAASPTPNLQQVTDISNTTTNNILIDPGLGNSLDLGGDITFNQASGSRVGLLTKLSQTGNHVWSLPNKTGTIMVTSDTTGAFTTDIIRVPGIDSFYFRKGGVLYGIKDSTGSGGSPNTSIGSGYKVAVNGTNDVKSLYGNWGIVLDSATSGQVGILVDTSAGKVATQTMLSTKLNTSDTANIRFRPYAGAGIGLSGTYPNITFTNTRDIQESMIEGSVMTQHNDLDADGFDFRINDAGELGLAGDSIVLAANAGANHLHIKGDSSNLNKKISYESNIHGTFNQYTLVDKMYADSVASAALPALTATRIGYGDGSNLLTGSAALTFNSGTGIITTPKIVLNTTVDAGGATDAAIIINRTLNVANNGHGYKDYTSVINNATSYASFDAQIEMASTGASDHNVAFQARHIINKGAGLLSTNWGFIDNSSILSPVTSVISFETNPSLSGGAAVTNRMGLRIKDYAGAANLATNTYGIWFDALTRSTNDKYGMYDNGSNKHYLSDIRAGSRLYVGGDATADSTLDVVNGIWGKRGVRFSGLVQTDLDTTNYKIAAVHASTGNVVKMYWPAGGGSGADALGTYLVQTATNAPANAQVMGALATGIVKNTTTTGVQSIAVAGDFPTLNQNTTGSAATLTTTRTIWGQNFNGSANVTGLLALGANDLTMTGSLAATGARVTKGWFTDVESTNMYTVGGTSLTSTFSPIAGSASIVTTGTITSGGLGTGAVIGGVTMTLGSDGNYDTYYRNSSGVLTKLTNGTTGQFLGANTGAAPSWQTPAGGSGLTFAQVSALMVIRY